MLKSKFVFWGESIALMLLFEEAGDTLEFHEHTPETYHDLVVDSGKVEIVGPDREWSVSIKAGESYNIPDDRQAHEVVALESGTVVANVYREYRPHLERLIGKDWS
jgi:hypothetical protein